MLLNPSSVFLILIDQVLYTFGMAMSEGKFHHLPDVYGIHPHTAKISAVLTYRLWIIWNKSKELTYILLITFCAAWAACLVVVTQSAALTSVVPYSEGKGCVPFGSSRIIWVAWVLVLLYNTGEVAFHFQADDISDRSIVTLTLLIIKARSSCGFSALRWNLTLMHIRLVRH